MRTLIAGFLLFITSTASQAQTDSVQVVWAFPISDYIVKQNDSFAVVQVSLPDAPPYNITILNLGVLKHCFQSAETFDTAMIGFGRCHLIKGDYRYFGIRLKKGQEAKAGDLLYTRVKMPVAYNGYLFKLAAHDIQLQKVDETVVYRKDETYYSIPNQAEENALLDSLVADIHYTGQVMTEQMPDQNAVVKGGLFNGQKLFDAMRKTTREQLVEFLKYMLARPQKYAGHYWKISEIFATWVVSETPQVKE
jgi:hypothetical protein